VFYLATPPTVGEAIVRGLGDAGLGQPRERSRIVVEKPFGRNLSNWRWQDVPFLPPHRQGVPTRASQACIQFRPVAHRSFPPSAARTWEPNRLVLQIQPEEGIRLRFQAEHPGASETLTPVDMQFRYRDFFAVPTPDAYETLLLDVLLADATLFMRADQVEAAWAIADPILNR
jgi:glucose-6-phosphate 1-dehydrogenase